MSDDRPQRRRAPARILIADDHELVRSGIRVMLESEGGIELVGEASDGMEALELCRRFSPDLVLMDIRMPRMDGMEATREIKSRHPGTSVLVLTTYENPDYLFEAVRAGAAGFVLKDATREELTGAVRHVLEGESTLDQGLAMELLRRLSGGGDSSLSSPSVESGLLESLTNREIEVLRLLSRGQTNREIAAELVVSTSTVKTHVEHIISKLGVSDRTQAAVRAVESGLFSSDETL